MSDKLGDQLKQHTAVVALQGRLRERRPQGVLAAGAAVLVAAVLLAGCSAVGLGSGTSSSGQLSASAVFSNVGDLVTGAPVQMSDVGVGSVTSISLDGSRAKVTMVIDRSAKVPANVTAELRRATILGQRLVELVPGPGPDRRLLGNGAVIARTEVISGVQALVSAGTAVFGAVSTKDLAQLVDASGEGFGGQSANLKTLLNDFNTVVAGYASQDSQITSLANSLNQLGSALAPSSKAQAQAIANLSTTTGILAAQSARFESLLQALNGLSVQGRSLLQAYFPQMTEQLHGLYVLAQILNDHLTSLGGIIHWLPGHNYSTSEATVGRDIQLIDAFIFCGIPGGGANPAYATTTCNPTPSQRDGS